MIKEFEIYTEQERERIKYAYKLAEEVLKEKKRENGHPFIEHPMGVAAIVAKEIGLTADCIEAIFLHEALRFRPSGHRNNNIQSSRSLPRAKRRTSGYGRWFHRQRDR